MATKKTKVIHKSNCVSQLRMSYKDISGNTIIVCGKYAFEWNIIVKNGNKITQMTFKCRKDAMKELNRKKKLLVN